MILFLTSLLKTRDYAVTDRRVPIALDDENGILSNLRRYLKRTVKLVVVANDQYDSADNDEKLAVIGDSLRMTGMDFEKRIMLDARNKLAAREALDGADLVILTGGKCVGQNAFFNEIWLRDLLSHLDGVVIGVSAGAMNSCKTVANFPEELSDIADPRWLNGMGFTDDVIIPHYDGATNRYQFECDGVEPVREYVMPMSFERDLVGLPNGSYVIIDEHGDKRYFGDVYLISHGKSKKIS